MRWFLRLSDILILRYSVLQHLATFCNILQQFSFLVDVGFRAPWAHFWHRFRAIAQGLRYGGPGSLPQVEICFPWFNALARSCTEHIYLMRLASALSTYSLHCPGQRGLHWEASGVWEKGLGCSWFHWNAYQLMVSSFILSPSYRIIPFKWRPIYSIIAEDQLSLGLNPKYRNHTLNLTLTHSSWYNQPLRNASGWSPETLPLSPNPSSDACTI